MNVSVPAKTFWFHVESMFLPSLATVNCETVNFQRDHARYVILPHYRIISRDIVWFYEDSFYDVFCISFILSFSPSLAYNLSRTYMYTFKHTYIPYWYNTKRELWYHYIFSVTRYKKCTIAVIFNHVTNSVT